MNKMTALPNRKGEKNEQDENKMEDRLTLSTNRDNEKDVCVLYEVIWNTIPLLPSYKVPSRYCLLWRCMYNLPKITSSRQSAYLRLHRTDIIVPELFSTPHGSYQDTEHLVLTKFAPQGHSIIVEKVLCTMIYWPKPFHLQMRRPPNVVYSTLLEV